MMMLFTKVKINKLSALPSSLLLPFLLLPFQLQAGHSLKGDIENGQSIAAEKCDRCHGAGGVSSDVDTSGLAS